MSAAHKLACLHAWVVVSDVIGFESTGDTWLLFLEGNKYMEKIRIGPFGIMVKRNLVEKNTKSRKKYQVEKKIPSGKRYQVENIPSGKNSKWKNTKSKKI